MKIIKYSRTFMPEIVAPGTGLTPTSPKSVVPTNNVVTIQDILNGKKYELPGGGGSWSSGKGRDTDQFFREDGDLYKRKERDLEILNRFLFSPNTNEEWELKIPGATKTFSSLEALLEYKRGLEAKGVKVNWISRARTAQNSQNNEAVAVAKAIKSTFMIQSLDISRKVVETGECFCVEKNMFVTCAHVIKKYDKNKINYYSVYDLNRDSNIKIIQDELNISAELISIDFISDIAILKADISCPELILDKEGKVNIGDEIFTIGSPHSFENNVSFGNISSLDREIYTHEGAPRYMFLDLSIHSGNSGGPIIKVNNGVVIGMITSIVAPQGEYGLNAGLPSRNIKDLLEYSIKRR